MKVFVEGPPSEYNYQVSDTLFFVPSVPALP